MVKVTILGKVTLDSCQRYQNPMVNWLSYQDWGIQVEGRQQSAAPGRSCPFENLLLPPLAQQNLQHKDMLNMRSGKYWDFFISCIRTSNKAQRPLSPSCCSVINHWLKIMQLPIKGRCFMLPILISLQRPTLLQILLKAL